MGDNKLLFENAGEYVCLNGVIYETARYIKDNPDAGLWDADVAYEVIRVDGGVPMFFEDHCERLNNSLAKLHADSTVPTEALAASAGLLLRVNGVSGGNIKIWAASCKQAPSALKAPPGRLAPTFNIFINVNRSYIPKAEYFETGAPAGLMPYTREDPNIKRYITGYKERVRELTEEGGFYEVLLYDAGRRLTEGSRSNLFFTIGGVIYTAPQDMILVGIRRKYVFAAAKGADIEIVEKPVSLDELENGAADGAFITGTGIGVLPISRINDICLPSASNPIIRKIMGEYAKIEDNYKNVFSFTEGFSW